MGFGVSYPTLASAQVYAVQSEDELVITGFFAAYFVIFGSIIAASIVLNVIWIILLVGPLKKIPPEHRAIEPGLVWLLLVPCFAMFWNFMVFQQIPQSFQRHFSSQGRTDLGDCGEQLGLWCAITVAMTGVPCVQYIAAPASLILLIIFLVKIHTLKGQISSTSIQVY